jgi:ubiquinone/menaquinone biosynthesis C-methylase UbiE
VASIDNIPLCNNEVDTIYCISVLEHIKIDTVKEVFREFRRILKPGGRVVLTMDITMDGRYSWARNPSQMFNVCGLKYAEYEDIAPKDAICEDNCGLYCYHAILYKED